MSTLRNEPAGEVFPLSSAQQRLWFLQLLNPADPAYHMTGAVRIRGRLDAGRLRRAFAGLCERHAALRTVFRPVGDRGGRVVLADPPDTFTVRDIGEAELAAAVAAEACRPFDLGTAAVRATCLRLGPADAALVMTVHHLVCDGASVDILTRDLAALYAGTPLPPLPAVDVTEWQGADDDAELAWWRQTLLDLPAPLELPAAAERGTVQLTVPAAVVEAVGRLAATERSTPFVVALAGFAMALGSAAGRRDLVIGTPVADRPSLAAEQQLVGMFVNTVPLRLPLPSGSSGSLRESVRVAHDVLTGALGHARVPFDRIVAASPRASTGGASALTQILFAWQTGPGMAALDLTGTIVTELPVPAAAGKAPLLLEVRELPGEWSLNLQYAGTSAELAHDVGSRLLDILGADPDRPLVIAERQQPVPAGPVGPTSEELPPAGADEVIEAVARAWREVLGVPRIRLDDDFFAIGGHSLLAVRLLSRIRALTGADLPLRAVFEASTVPALAARARAARSTAGRSARPGSSPRVGPVTIPPAPAGPAMLSAQQRAYWLVHQLDPQDVSYNITGAVYFDEPVDADALAAGLATVVARQPALRTTFRPADGEPVPVVQDPPVIERTVLPGATPDALAAAAAAAADRLARRPFDLTRDPPLRAVVLEGECCLALVLGTTHAAFDGSYDVLRSQLERAYAGQPDPAGALAYSDYACWQRDRLPELIRAQLPYWRERLDGIEPLELPADHPRPKLRSGCGRTRRFALDPQLAGRLRELAAAESATVHMVLLAGWLVLLRRLSGQRRFAVGCPVDIRPEGAEQLIGCFVNPVPIVVELPDECSFREAVRRTRAALLDAYEHADVPFDVLLDELGTPRDLSRTPVFQHMFHYGPAPAAPVLESPGRGPATARWVDWQPRSARFDTLWAIRPSADGGLQLLVEYTTDLFTDETIERAVHSFGCLLTAAAGSAERRIDELAMLEPAERMRILHVWNQTARTVPGELTLHRRFERAVDRDPAAPALSFAGSTQSYAELEQRANRWAALLAELGVRRGDRVGLWLDRCAELVELALGILKLGAAYVPLDPAWPGSRVLSALHEVDARLILGSGRLLPALHEADWPGDRVAVDDAGIAERLAALPATRPDPASDPDDCAYVMFTSGSTGAPKGVLVSHRPVANVLDWVNRTFAVTAADRLLQVAPFGFDLSVYDIFGILSAGGSIRIAEPADINDPERMWSLLDGDGITFWDSAPASLLQLVPLLESRQPSRPSLRLVFLSGDWIPVALPGQIRQAFPAAEVVGLGGATEAVIWSNFQRIEQVPPHWRSIPYGRPIQNARYYVLDGRLEPCPVGTPGDLHIGGPVLARGYTDAALTAERFVPDPHAGRPGAVMYRTGDRARFWPDGTIEFLGRSDRQVKLRGRRIELAEIEVVLGKHPGVAACAVQVRPDGRGERRLVAWYLPRDGRPIPVGELRAQLAHRLPGHMVPAAFVALAGLPVTNNGKLDADSLPDPPAVRPELAEEYLAPRTPDERMVAEVWSSVLGVESIGVRDDFFELGGDSAAVVHIRKALEETLQRRVSVVELFDHPTVESLAAHLGRGAVRRQNDQALQRRLEVLHRNRLRRNQVVEEQTE